MSQDRSDFDAIKLSVFSHRFMSIAEQMGRCVYHKLHIFEPEWKKDVFLGGVDVHMS